MNNRNKNVRTRNCGYEPQPSSRQTVTVPDGVKSLAMVYTVSQSWRGIDNSECGFCRGTIFDELDKPFYGDKCKRDCR